MARYGNVRTTEIAHLIRMNAQRCLVYLLNALKGLLKMSLKKENDAVEKRDQRFDCRMSAKEKNEIKRLASLHNMNVSEYVRHKALSYQSEPLVDVEKVISLMEKKFRFISFWKFIEDLGVW